MRMFSPPTLPLFFISLRHINFTFMQYLPCRSPAFCLCASAAFTCLASPSYFLISRCDPIPAADWVLSFHYATDDGGVAPSADYTCSYSTQKAFLRLLFRVFDTIFFFALWHKNIGQRYSQLYTYDLTFRADTTAAISHDATHGKLTQPEPPACFLYYFHDDIAARSPFANSPECGSYFAMLRFSPPPRR